LLYCPPAFGTDRVPHLSSSRLGHEHLDGRILDSRLGGLHLGPSLVVQVVLSGEADSHRKRNGTGKKKDIAAELL